MFNLCIDKSFLFQQICINSKNQTVKSRIRTSGMHTINNKKPSMKELVKKNLWVDPYEGESTDTEEDE